MRWYLRSLKKYAVFDGRSPRREWGWFTIFTAMGLALCSMADGYFELPIYHNFNLLGKEEAGPVAIAFSWIMVTPWVATAVRRLHDLNITGWAAVFFPLPQIHPLFSIIALPLVLMLLARLGRPGDNAYGPDPLADEPVYTYPLTDEQIAILEAQKTQEVVPPPVTLFGAYIKALRFFRVFSGRATRAEYWGYLAFLFLFGIPAGLVSYFYEVHALTGAYVLVNLFPLLALTSRRLNDAGQQAIWKYLFLAGFPLVGLVLLVPLLYPGFLVNAQDVMWFFIGIFIGGFFCSLWGFLVAAFFESSPFVNKHGPYPFRDNEKALRLPETAAHPDDSTA